MTSAEYLQHVTLITGDSRRSYRDECDDRLIGELAPIVAECEAHGRAEFPSPTGLMELRRIADADPPSRHAAVWAIGEPTGPAIVTIALAMNARIGASLWRTLHEAREEPLPLATQPNAPAPAPWLAVLIHVPAMLPVIHPALAWLGDAERCIAWAWIEGIHKKGNQGE